MMQGHIVILIVVLSVMEIQCEGPYNRHAIVIFEPPDYQTSNTSFGYSLMMRKTKTKRQLIIGAPTATTKALPSLRTGALYKCDVPKIKGQEHKLCHEMKVDDRGNGLVNGILQKKNNMSLGFSMAGTQNSEEPLVVCASRWQWQMKHGHTRTWLTNGMCYNLDNYKDGNYKKVKNVIPISNPNENKMTNQYVEAGWASHTPNGQILLIGAPKYNDGKGIVYYYANSSVNQPLTLECETCEEGETAHFGYSITSGLFNFDDPEYPYYAISAPEADNKAGKVLIFESQHNNGSKFISNHAWSPEGTKTSQEKFGYSLAVIRQTDYRKTTVDLAVGAPYYGSNLHGRVYLFTSELKTNNSTKFFRRKAILEDTKAVNSMFGAAIVDLGDLDGDLFPEIGIGAPEANNGRGALYVYEGRFHKILQKITFDGFMGFGNSLASIEFGDKPCQDVAVGALGSNVAVLMPCHVKASILPVCHVNATNIYNDSQLEFEANCHLTTTRTGVGMLSINTGLQVTVTVKYQNSIVAIKEALENSAFTINTTLTRSADNDFELTIPLTIMPKKMEYYENLILFMEYKMNNDPSESPTYNSNAAVIDPNTYNRTVYLGCATVECQPNLILTLEKVEADQIYIRGRVNTSASGLKLVARIHNNGEAAYNAWLHVQVPADLDLDLVDCDRKGATLQCKLCSPIWSGQEINLELPFRDRSKKWRDVSVSARIGCDTCKEISAEASLHAHQPHLNMTIKLFDRLGKQVYVIGTQNTSGLECVAHIYNSGDKAYNVSLHIQVPEGLNVVLPQGCQFRADGLECRFDSPIAKDEDVTVKVQFLEFDMPRSGSGSDNTADVVILSDVSCTTCGTEVTGQGVLQIRPDHEISLTMAHYGLHGNPIKSNYCGIKLDPKELSPTKPIVLIKSYEIINTKPTPWTNVALHFSILGKHSRTILKSTQARGINGEWHKTTIHCEVPPAPATHLSRICTLDLEPGETTNINFTLSMDPRHLNALLDQATYVKIATEAFLVVPYFASTEKKTSTCLLSKEEEPVISSPTVFTLSLSILGAVLLIFTFSSCWILCRRTRSKIYNLRRDLGEDSGCKTNLLNEINNTASTLRRGRVVPSREHKRKYSYVNESLEYIDDDNTEWQKEETENTPRDNITVDWDHDEVNEELL